MTLVVVCAALRHARQHRQARLCAIECLDLALFVDTEHQRAVRRRQIESDDVADKVKCLRFLKRNSGTAGLHSGF